MEVRNELKALIAQNGATLKKVCEILTQNTAKIILEIILPINYAEELLNLKKFKKF